MDSHSRSASPREPIRPQHRPPSPPASPAAFDNRAYQHDESDPNHNDSFTSNGPQQNGHTKEPNGETKTLEAVNLELINLTPKNGNAKKKDVEVDMNASNPYDEYFVPVNEHRKYMRGEKLYVTADKRGEKGGCKRPLCWTLLGLVVAAVVAVIVLAATGILFTSSPTTLEQYNTSISSARALGGIAHDHAHDLHDHDHDHHDHADHNHADHNHADHTMQPPVEHGPDTQNDEAVEHSMGSDENDSSLYVPRTVEGELKIDNEEFSPMLQDPESNEYKEFVSTFTEGLKRAVFDKNTLDYGGNDITVEVVHLREGSVIVTYRIHWTPKMNTQPSEELLTPKTLEMKLENYLNRYDRMISNYHVAEDKMVARPVLDICQINQNDCEHGCEFDEQTLDFTCTCPTGLILDMNNPKKCMSILEHPSNNEHTDKEAPVPTTDSNTHAMQPTPQENSQTDEQNIHEHENTFDWKETHHMMPVTTTESDADVNFSHIFGSDHHEHETESSTEHKEGAENSEHEVEPKPEPEPEPEPTSEPHAHDEPHPSAEPQPAAEPEPTAEPKPAPEPAPEPEPTAEPQPAAEPHPTAEPQPTEGSKMMPELLPTPEPQPGEEHNSEEAHPTEQPQPDSEPHHHLDSQEEADTQPQPTAEPKPEPEPTSEPHVETEETNEDHEHSIHMIESEDEPTAELKPNAEPESRTEAEFETDHHTEMHTTMKPQEIEVHEVPMMHETVHEEEENRFESTGRALDQENNVTSEENPMNIDDNTEAKPTTGSSMEITTTRISISEPNIINEPSYEAKPEIISILNNNKEAASGSVITSRNTVETTTYGNEWLEHNTETHMNGETGEIEEEKNSVSNFQSEMDAIMKNLTGNKEHESESRSFKHIDSEVAAETTTMKPSSKSEEELSFDLITKENEVPVTESIGKVGEETTKPIISLHSDIDINEPEKQKDSKDINASEITTTMRSFTNQHQQEQSTISSENKEETGETTTLKPVEEINKESKITSLIEEAKAIDSTTLKPLPTTTLAQEIVTEYSIVTSHHNFGSEEDKQLMDALENKKPKEINETSSESNDVPDESSDITFDAINMLYNRSSKSIETHNKTGSDGMVSETNNNIADVVVTTTESDWLSEPVTETNYEEAMNKMEKHDTTETTITKMDDIMNRELTKDDFEPDYLNNMGSSDKPSEQDEPAYGMVHDYDNEDSRVKRVHTEITTEAIANEIGNNNPQEIKTDASPITNVPIETTTVSEYIYKSAERATNQPEEDTNKANSNESIMSIISHEPVVTAAPAPVWEESESERELAVKEAMDKGNNDITTHRAVMVDDIIAPTTMIAVASTNAPEPTTMAPVPTTTVQAAAAITENKMGEVNDNESTMSETQNATQVKNLNVTIYEISNHNSNTTLPSPKTNNANSAEYEDHETDMNPFLPEVENNKSLVKKLQEGHNIEPTNLNEMQNENVEEHSVASEGHASFDDGLAVISKGNEESLVTTTASSSTTEGDTSFNELLMHVTQANETEPPRTNAPDLAAKSTEAVSMEENSRMTKAHEKEILPVSTFLMDTDDLDAYKPATKIIPERDNTVTPVPASINSDSEYLSVVPIEEERKEEDEALNGNYQKDNIQELNDISDSPKNSDRRTLDETKFDSVINNEA